MKGKKQEIDYTEFCIQQMFLSKLKENLNFFKTMNIDFFYQKTFIIRKFKGENEDPGNRINEAESI